MKSIIIALISGLAFAAATDSCYDNAIMDCAQTSQTLDMLSCNAKYGDYGHGVVAKEMQAFANLHVQRSFDYLLSASYFNNYITNRAGFSKLFRKLADSAWEKSIDIIKHINQRGHQMDFAARSTRKSLVKSYTVEVTELEAMAKVLDSEKELAERAFFIHREATRNNDKLHDPEITQYLEEEFIEYQSKTIRDLAGHTADLKKFIASNDGKDLSLGLYLFDEYLQKAV